MQPSELSVLIPTQNIEKEISSIISFAAEQTKEIDAEFIIVDMGSTDKTVLEAVLEIKRLNLRGFVIQNGVSNVPTALNTALQKAGGKYLTFFFARRLYSGVLSSYLDIANRFEADVVFGCFTKEEYRAAERYAISSVIRRPEASRYIREAVTRERKLDLAAVMVRREFLMSKQLSFDDNCTFGYAEEFLLQSLLYAGSVMQVPVMLHRQKELELKRGKSGSVGLKIFSRVEAACNVLESAQSATGEIGDLPVILEKRWLPMVVMNCIDVVLREGISYHNVKDYLYASGYGKLLVVDRRADAGMKRRLVTWKTVPWLYRP